MAGRTHQNASTREPSDEPYDVDPLYVGLTRPAMLKGITDTYAVMLMTVEVTIFVGIGGVAGVMYALASAPALYLFGYLMCLKDPRIFAIWHTRLQHFNKGRRRRSYWGGASYDPF